MIKLCLTSKNFKIFKNALRHFLWACSNGYGSLLFGLFHGLELRPNPILDMQNFNFGANNCPSHTLWPKGHIVCIRAPKILLNLSPTMRPKIQLLAQDVEFQRQERAKSDQMKRQVLIPQEKVPVIIKFKPSTFVLPPPNDFVPPKNNHSTSSRSNPESSSFLPIKNLFSLSKITPFGLEKGKRTSLDLD